jgi:PAS domain S-box-containing protein
MTSRKGKDRALLEEIDRLRRRIGELERGGVAVRPGKGAADAAELLRRSERRLQDAQQVAHLGWWEWDVAGDAVTWSDELYRIFGLRPDEFRATYEGYLERVHADDRERVRRTVDASFRTGRPFAYDARIARPDGSVRWIQARGEVVAGAGGRPIRMLGTAIDITDRKRADEEVLKARKLESVGVLAGGIAHDFNNLLTVILGNVLLLKTRLEPDDPDLGKLVDAEEACLRARRLTHQLLTFAEGGAPIRRATFLSTLVEDACRVAGAGSGAGVRTALSLPPDLWPVEVDEGQIGQALNTLMLNAAQAMPSGGVIHAEAANAVIEDADAPEPGLPEPGRYVRVTIRDEGVGIPPEDLPRIFDPYFSSRERGSGLGLAAAYSIVQRHGGAIRAESAPGRGTTFVVHLPAAAGPSEETEAFEALSAAEPRGGRILVMDDEALVRVMIGDMLRHFGHEAVLTSDGAEAVEAYRRAFRDGARFAAVILDLTVPGGMGGREAMRLLLAIDPDVRGIVASGYSNDPVMAEYRKHGFRGVVAKPFRLDELRRTLRQVLAPPPGGPGGTG